MPLSKDDAKQLKEMVAKAKRAPVNFAACLGLKPENAVVQMDKILTPDVLGRKAKAAGETAKVVAGTLSIDGKTATISSVEAAPTGAEKQLKLFFKEIDLNLDFVVRVIDPLEATWIQAWGVVGPLAEAAINGGGPTAGQIRALVDTAQANAAAKQFQPAIRSLDSIKTLLAAGPGGDNKTTTAQKPDAGMTETTGGQSEEKAEKEEPAKIDPKALIGKLGQIKPRIGQIQGPLAQRLTEMFQQAVELVRGGSVQKATDLVARLEAALAKLEASTGTSSGTTTSSQQESQPKETETPVDPKLAKIGQAQEQLRKRAGAVTNPDTRKAMNDILDAVTKALDGGEAEAALSGIKKVQDGLTLQAEVDRLMPLVSRAASTGSVADVNALNLLFNFVADKIPAADHNRAMASLARVEQMLKAGETQEKSAFEQDEPLEIRPYAEARLNWSRTRSKLRSELTRLQDEIAQALTKIGMPPEMAQNDKLFDHIKKLDARLEDKLAEIVGAEPGDKREALKAQARVLIGEYRQELGSDFFRDVDSNNGFTQVDVASSAHEMLDDLAKVLAD